MAESQLKPKEHVQLNLQAHIFHAAQLILEEALVDDVWDPDLRDVHRSSSPKFDNPDQL